MGPTEQEYRQALAWIEQMRARVAQLEAENGNLLRQLDDLRRGVGVAVVIQGRAIPLAAPAASMSGRQTGAPVGFPTAPAPYPLATGPMSTPYHSAYQHSAPLSSPLGGGTQPGAVSPLHGDSAWLTGQMPAVQPGSAGSAGSAGQRGGAQQRQPHPAQRVTPEWLREETQRGQPPAQNGPASGMGTGQIPAMTPYPGASNARPRGGVQARPLGGQEPGERLQSLAELTGHIPAVRGRAKLSKRERDEFDDSFVLG